MKTYIGKAWFGPPRGALRSLDYLAIPKLLLLLTVEQRVKGGGLSLLEKKTDKSLFPSIPPPFTCSPRQDTDVESADSKDVKEGKEELKVV